MADMQIAIGFGRETGGNFALVLIGFEVIGDDMANKIGRVWVIGVGHALRVGWNNRQASLC